MSLGKWSKIWSCYWRDILSTQFWKKLQQDLFLSPTKEPPGHKPLVVNGAVVGPFEEEEEVTGVASDVVQVQGEDPATPGPLLEGMTPGP